MAAEEIIIDLTNYKERIGARVTPDRYHVVVEDAETDRSKAGNPMVNLWLKVQGGPHDGATLTDRLTLTEKSLFRVVGFMQAIGLPTPNKRFKINLQRFIGQHLLVDVDDGEPYNGRVKSEVRGYMRLTEGETAAETDAKAEEELLAGADEAESAPDPEPEAVEVSEATEDKGEPVAVPGAPEEIDLDDIDLG